MTTPLFDAKAHFSEYVTLAENGDVVEITKHGKTTAVIIGMKEYNDLKNKTSYEIRNKRTREEYRDVSCTRI